MSKLLSCLHALASMSQHMASKKRSKELYMSSLRGRTRDSSWQWLVIGLVLGLGCSSVFCLAGYATNYIRITLPGQALDTGGGAVPTVIIQVVTATQPPATATSSEPLAPTATQQQAAAPANITPGVPTQTPFVIQSTPTGGGVQPTTEGTVIGPPPTFPPESASVITPGAQIAIGGPDVVQAVGPSIPKTDMVNVQGGIFTMGTTLKEATQAVDDCTSRDKAKCEISMTEDSIPEHTVTVNAFQIEKYEVTYEQFVAFLNFLGPNSHTNQCGGEPCAVTQGPDYLGSYIKFDGTRYTVANEIYRNRPVTFVTWYGAKAYCEAIDRRLPTEAEWERAARGNDKRIYPWGNDWDPTKARTNKPTNEGGPDEINLFKTGETPEGVFNLGGNVSEWVFDYYAADYYKNLTPAILNPQGPDFGATGTRVVRGGDWDKPPFFARTVHRTDADPGTGNSTIGFRCAGDQGLTQPAPAGQGTLSPGGNVTKPTATPVVPQK
jgi:formylglycine-generating enzyme required for sulfatase activity